MAGEAAALFYPAAIKHGELVKLVAGIKSGAPPLDVVDFPAETGGSAQRELAIPYVPDMDEVVVDAAQLQLRARTVEMEVSAPTIAAGTGSDAGVVVALDRPAQLAYIELELPTFDSGVTDDPTQYSYRSKIKTHDEATAGVKEMRIVVRLAERSGTGFTFGAPIFADPDFPPPGPLFGRIMSGLTVTVSSQRVKITPGSVQAAGWLIQFAYGDEAAELTALGFTAKVTKVAIQAAPRDVEVVIPATGDREEIELWSHPDALLPSTGDQEIDFSPIAQRLLAERLAAAAGSTGDLTLPIPLEFRSKAGGQLDIRSKVLDASYRVRPVAPDAAVLHMRGTAVALALDGPAGRRPETGTLTLVATHLGRERNAGSSPPPLDAPAAGIRVGAERWAAAPVSPQGGGELVSAGVYVSVEGNTEAVLEIRADAAGVPGAPLAPAAVVQPEPGTSGWIDFELAAPLPVADGQPLWVTLRSTRGELLWFGQGAGNARVSLDGGRSWGEADPALAAPVAPLVQLFHAVSDPVPAPRVDMLLGTTPLGQIPLVREGEPLSREFAARGHALPGAVLDAYLELGGTGRAPLELTLTSAAVLDLTVQDALLAYDPFAPGVRSSP